MAAVTLEEIFRAQAGGYSWAEGRNCMATLALLYEQLCSAPQPANLAIFRQLARGSEAHAWRTCLRAGGPRRFYLERAGAGAIEIRDFRRLRPGDVLFWDSDIRVGAGVFAGRPGAEAMGFVDGGHQRLHWTAAGLQPVREAAPCAAMRFV